MPNKKCTSWSWSYCFWRRLCPCCPVSILLHVGFVPISRFYQHAHVRSFPTAATALHFAGAPIRLLRATHRTEPNQKHLPTNSFNQKGFTPKPVMQEDFYIRSSLHHKFFTPETRRRDFCTRNILHRTGFALTPQALYTRRLLHHRPFTQNGLRHAKRFALQTTNRLHHNPYTPEALYTVRQQNKIEIEGQS